MFARVRTAASTRVARIALIGCACGVAVGGGLIALSLHHSRNAATTSSRPPSTVIAPTRSVRVAPLSPKPIGLIAALTTSTLAFRSPGGAAEAPIAPTWHGAPISLPVIATRDNYLEVRLPTRPNGSTAWIRERSVHLYRTPFRIVVDLGTRHLFLYRNGKLVLNAPAGIGTVADPTPTGHFFVAFFAKAPSAAWGPFVLVTSAHSNAISDWEESGDAIVAIHGPLGESAAIGSNGARISHGCVRLKDVDLAQLRKVPDGSPVDIIS